MADQFPTEARPALPLSFPHKMKIPQNQMDSKETIEQHLDHLCVDTRQKDEPKPTIQKPKSPRIVRQHQPGSRKLLRLMEAQRKKEERDYLEQKMLRERLSAEADAAFVPPIDPQNKLCGHNFCYIQRDLCCECSDERPRPHGVLEIYETVYIDTVGYRTVLLQFWRDYCPACQGEVSLKYTGVREPQRPLEAIIEH